METFVETVTSMQFIATVTAAIAVFATILSIVVPMLAREQMNQRMKVMALERDKMRTQRIAELAAKERAGALKLRQTPKGFMQAIVERLNLRAQDSEELRPSSRWRVSGTGACGLHVFRVAAPPLVFVVALFYLFLVAELISAADEVAIALAGAGYYCPMSSSKFYAKRRQSIQTSFPKRSICC
jgi:tight adherence protein C